MEDKLGEIRAYIHEYEEHKEALENGQPFERRLTAKKMGSKSGSGPRGKKRKNTRGDKKSAKRRRASDSDFEDDDDDFIDDSCIEIPVEYPRLLVYVHFLLFCFI